MTDDMNKTPQEGTETYIEEAAQETPQSPASVVIPPKPKGGIFSKIVIVLVVLALIGLAYVRILQNNQTEAASEELPTYVTIAQAEIGAINVTTTVTGQVQSQDSAMIFAGASEVKRISVEVGDYVRQGAHLFTLDSTQARASYDQAVIARDMAQDGLEQAKTNLTRTIELYNSGAVPLVSLEQAENAVTQAQSAVRQAQASVSSASEAMGMVSFTAPISGYVTEVNIQEGMYATGQSAAVVINDLDNLEISASVSEYLVGHLQEGMPAQYKISALGDQVYEGILDTVALAPSSMGLTYPITVSLAAENEGRVMPGMFAEVIIISDSKEDVLIIPSSAVMIRGGRSMVVVLEDGDLPYMREVETGLDDGQTVEIVSGLQAGETVIVKGQYYVTEGQPVVVVAE